MILNITEYYADTCPAVLEFTLNQDLEKLSHWLSANYLTMNNTKTQAMILGNSKYLFNLQTNNSQIEIRDSLKILGVTIDRNLSYKLHIKDLLSKVYPLVAALRRLKRLVPHDTIIRLYKAYVVPHYDYCSPLLLGIRKTITHKLESVNSFALRTLLNQASNTGYDHVLGLSSMSSIEHRRYEQSLMLFYKCVKQYNLRNSGLNVEQPSYSGLFFQFFHL